MILAFGAFVEHSRHVATIAEISMIVEYAVSLLDSALDRQCFPDASLLNFAVLSTQLKCRPLQPTSENAKPWRA